MTTKVLTSEKKFKQTFANDINKSRLSAVKTNSGKVLQVRKHSATNG